MATKKTPSKKAAPKKRAPRKKKAEAASRGLEAADVVGDAPAHVAELSRAIVADGGAVVGAYRDPLGGAWQVLASLPIDRVEPATFQRDLSDTHVKKLMGVIERLDRYLDPVVAVRAGEGRYATPNGHHRLEAMRRLGAKAIVALVVPEVELAYQILALNTEKAPNLKDRALETIRMARALVELGDPVESTFALQFEEPSHLTIGVAYERRPRLSGSTYHPIVKRTDAFLDEPMSKSLEVREARAEQLLAVDDRVAALVKALKDAGFSSPYLKPFVVARLNPVRSSKVSMSFDDAMARMLAAADGFDVGSVEASQIGGGGGYSASSSDEDEE